MAFDFKKEYRAFYMAAAKPEVVSVPAAKYVAVRGHGDPNEPDGAYQAAVAVLYTVAYTIKMSKLGDHRIDGYFDFVVPPLESFWQQAGVDGVDLSNKAAFEWIAVIRLPDFVTEADVLWAAQEASRRKKLDCSQAALLTIDEGLCVQILHMGPFDTEAQSIALMDAYVRENGFENDISPERLHHEIYLSDARKVAPEQWKTVIRHPIRRKGEA